MKSSGGFWQFLASLSPLETWRKYMIFRHKRDQDRRYREAAEARKLELENEARELAIIEKRVKIAKQLGVTNDEMRSLRQRTIGQIQNGCAEMVSVSAHDSLSCQCCGERRRGHARQ